MRNGPWQRKSLRAVLLAATPLFCLSTPAVAQNSPAQNNKAVQDNRPVQDNDITRRDIVEFNHFLDNHREIAEQVRKDPSLLDNRQFVGNHAELEAYLNEHPGVRDEIRQNPDAFMQQEDRFDHAESGQRDLNRDHMASFGAFLGGHSNVARELSENPDRVKDQQYVDDHTELWSYLNTHPDVRQDLMANPSGFVKGAQQFSAGTSANGSGTTTGSGTTGVTGSSSRTSTTPAAKPKQ
jgi:hypothetical protein